MAANQTMLVTIDKVEHNMETGWFNIHAHAETGAKVRFSTKIREKAEEAASLRGRPGVRVWHDEKPSRGTNPHTGQPYPPDRWYDRAEETFGPDGGGGGGIETVGAQAASAAPMIPAEAPRGEDPRRAWRICLQSGGKLAVATLPLMPNEQRTFDTQKQIALAWARWFYFTPPPERDSMGASAPPTPQQAYGDVPALTGGGYESDYDLGPPVDDIPF